MAAKEKTKKLCFVVGPIGADDSDRRIHSDWVLEEIIEPVMKEFDGFEVRRADKMDQPGLIDSQIIAALLDAELVIADLTTQNPNAFYEIGIRHMAQKPIIHMHLASETIPFDISLYRSIAFQRTRPADLKLAREKLKAAVEAVFRPDYVVENPVTKTRGRVQLEQHATPEQRVVIDQLEAIQRRLSYLEKRSTTMHDHEEYFRSSRIVRLLSEIPMDAGFWQAVLLRAKTLARVKDLRVSSDLTKIDLAFEDLVDPNQLGSVVRQLITEFPGLRPRAGLAAYGISNFQDDTWAPGGPDPD